MRISLNSLDEQFLRDQFTVAGETVVLVHPKHLYARWRPDTLKFRSSVWTLDGDPVSLSFPKFFNWGEFTEVVPLPNQQEACQAIEKIDGSTLIVSQYKGQTIVRTRGTLDARTCDNGIEIDFLIERFPKAFNLPANKQGTAEVSYLFEWVTDDPQSKLVINYQDTPRVILTGAVCHSDYRLYTQAELDELAATIEVQRPPVHEFECLEDMREKVAQFEGTEGVCLYYNNGQSLVKIKSQWYLKLHRLKTDFQGVESIIDLYLDLDCPDYHSAYQYLVENVDFETAEACRGHLSSVCDVMKQVNLIQTHMKQKVAQISASHSDRDQCIQSIQKAYGKTNRAKMAIAFLDGSDRLTRDQVKKLIFQNLS